jgi:hypothetical protein
MILEQGMPCLSFLISNIGERDYIISRTHSKKIPSTYIDCNGYEQQVEWMNRVGTEFLAISLYMASVTECRTPHFES